MVRKGGSVYELVGWRFGTVVTEQHESKDDAIADWVRGLDYNEFWSPGFVDRDQQIVFLPGPADADGGRHWLSHLEEGLGISLADFQIEFFKIPEP